jgi:amino acid adenylation domain-containing protein
VSGNNIEAVYPLSAIQQGFLFHALYEPSEDPYFGQISCELEGPLDLPAFRRAWQRLVDRHPVLRTAFAWQDLEKPLQVVGRQVRLPILEEDWRALHASEQEWRWEELQKKDRETGFRLSKAPLTRVALVRVADERYRLLWSYHHLLVDGWSVPRLFDELLAFYAAFRRGADLELEVPRPFRDFIDWVQQRDLAAAETFWRRALAGLTAPTPLPGESRTADLAGAGPRWGEERRDLSVQATASLQAFARDNRLTLGTVLEGAWAFLLSRLTGEDDVVFGLTVSGRPTSLAGAESMIGPLINTLPLRIRVDDRAPVAGWLADLQSRQAEARQYDHTPLPEIQGWSELPRGSALFETLLVIENYPLDGAGRNGKGEITLRDVRSAESTNYPLVVVAVPGRRLVLQVKHDRGRVRSYEARRVVERLAFLLEQLADHADLCLRDLAPLAPIERHQLLREWNESPADYVLDRCLHEIVEAQAARSPEAIAVVFEEERITYRELNRRANRLARRLQSLGVAPEVRVALCLERSSDLPLAILAVLKAGGAYVPLDPRYPRERLELMVQDAAPAVLVTRRELAGEIAGAARRILCLEDLVGEGSSAGEDENPYSGAVPDNLAYVIYTSGSTGRPKGVTISHRAINNRLLWMQSAFPLEPRDRVLQKTPFSFDASIWELFVPLMFGARLVMARPGGHQDSGYMVAAIERYGITVLQLVPSMLGAFLAEPGLAGCTSLRRVFCGGEALSRELQDRLLARLPVELQNLYGPTEAAIDASCHPCGRDRRDEGEAVLPIGRPLANMRIYLLDSRGGLAPQGVPGELHIGGVGLTRGYLNRPDLTAERLVPDPFDGLAGERLYRTGDLARHREDGVIEFLGRIDQQVKVRGFRIEPGEIEAALTQHPEVRDAVVVVREDHPGDLRLVAYFVPQQGRDPGVAGLRELLAGKLPEHMVPGSFVRLEVLPALPNGKVDRSALPAPGRADFASGRMVAPRNLTEEVLAEIWGEVLGIPEVSVHDSFLAAGGHSLLATRMLARLRQAFQVELPLSRIFEATDLAGLAEEIEDARRGSAPALPPILPGPRGGDLPLSFAQQRMWFLHRMDPSGAAYNIPMAVKLSGRLVVPAFAASLREVVRRHEILRTRFPVEDGRPVPLVEETVEIGPEVVDLGGLLEPEAELRAILAEQSRRYFDLETGPLLRALLIRLGEREHVVLITLHHIVSDAWSGGIFVRELATIYRALVTGRPSPLPDLPIQYADFASWQREWLQGERLERELRPWLERLGGPLPVLALPADRPRAGLPSGRGGKHPLEISPDLLETLKRLSRRQGVTLFVTLLAAFDTLLFRYTGQRDLLVGTPSANRGRREIEDLIGLFINTLVLRTELAGAVAFTELLQRVREVVLHASDYPDLPFEMLVEALRPDRQGNRAPLFQVMFGLQNTPLVTLDLPDLAVSLIEIERGTTKFDLVLEMVETHAALISHLEYSTDLFDAETAARMGSHLRNLLAGVAASPERSLWDLPLLSPEERRQILHEGRARQGSPQQPEALHRLFAACARRRPMDEALRCGSERLTYGELDGRSNRLARHLRSLGVTPETRVGLLCGRSLDMIVGILGILKAGGAYVPLDPAYPRERLEFMLADAGVAGLVSHGVLADGLARPGMWRLRLEDGEALATWSDEDPEWNLPASGAAYVIYTSGSTGRPKGVVVSHANVWRLFEQTQPWFGFGAGDVWTMFHSYAFDFSVWELWGALLFGGRLVIVPSEVSRAPEMFFDLLAREGVTVLNQTPSAFRQLMRVAEERGFPAQSLRLVIFGGEALEMPSLRRWFEGYGDERPLLVNMYGITETTVHVTYRPLKERDTLGAGSPIGVAIPDLELFVLDGGGELVSPGVAGELHVGGGGVARGYLGRPDLTARRFVPHPFATEPGARLYRTGDLVRRRGASGLDYLGRIDEQVKIRGFRIELGEIESVLTSHPDVGEAVVLVREDQLGDRRLAAYVVPARERWPEEVDLRSHLKERLPDYMIPADFVILETLPLTANGKLDRKALPTLAEMRPAAGQRSTPLLTPSEEVLAGIWSELLGRSPESPEDDFFEIGGHSLLATQVVSRVREAFGVEIQVPEIFAASRLRDLAAQIEAAIRGGQSLATPPIEPAPRGGDLPLSFAQQRLWFLDHLQPGNRAFNIAGGLRLEGSLDARALRWALDEVVRRHEVLRTRFVTVKGSPVQVVNPPVPLPLPEVDLRSLAEKERAACLARLGTEAARQPFDLAHGPLLRLTLVHLAEQRHVLLFAMHHIITDGWSTGVLVRELGALYAASLAGDPSPLPELRIQYADFARWQRQWLQGEVLERQLAYWRGQLAGAPAALNLRLARSRPDEQTSSGLTRRVTLPGISLSALKALGRRHDATLFMTVLAAFQVLLRHYSGEEDIVVGTDVANRGRKETEGLIGFFINQLALRTDLSDDPRFGELLGRVRETALAAYAHQDLPFEKLVDALKLDRHLRHAPVFQLKIFVQNAPLSPLELLGLTLAPLELERGTANLDLTIALWESGDRLIGWINYLTDLFDAAAITRFLAGFETILARVIDNSDLRVTELCECVSQTERKRLDVEKTERQQLNLKRLKGVKPRSLDLRQQEMVRMEPLRPDQKLPLVVQPNVEDLDLAEWAREHRALIIQKLQEHGALLFRGFAIDSADEFERFAREICPVLFNENGEHPRQSVSGNIYTPVFYPADQHLLWHNENSFNHRWPLKIMFCCMRAPDQGGETPVVDSRGVYERLDPEIQRAFTEKQIMYSRNYGQGVGLDWETVFNTSDRSEAERKAAEQRLTLEWKEDGKLRTRCVRPAVIAHPVTGELSWFNQAQHWHTSCLDPATRSSIESVFREEDLPRQCYFGDGTPIPDEMMRKILAAYAELEVCFPWQKGDIMLLDNVLAAHGRNAFAGERKILVAMGDMTSFDQV